MCKFKYIFKTNKQGRWKTNELDNILKKLKNSNNANPTGSKEIIKVKKVMKSDTNKTNTKHSRKLTKPICLFQKTGIIDSRQD